MNSATQVRPGTSNASETHRRGSASITNSYLRDSSHLSELRALTARCA